VEVVSARSTEGSHGTGTTPVQVVDGLSDSNSRSFSDTDATRAILAGQHKGSCKKDATLAHSAGPGEGSSDGEDATLIRLAGPERRSCDKGATQAYTQQDWTEAPAEMKMQCCLDQQGRTEAPATTIRR
jgi:hypothetical protein